MKLLREILMLLGVLWLLWVALVFAAAYGLLPHITLLGAASMLRDVLLLLGAVLLALLCWALSVAILPHFAVVIGH